MHRFLSRRLSRCDLVPAVLQSHGTPTYAAVIPRRPFRRVQSFCMHACTYQHFFFLTLSKIGSCAPAAAVTCSSRAYCPTGWTHWTSCSFCIVLMQCPESEFYQGIHQAVASSKNKLSLGGRSPPPQVSFADQQAVAQQRALETSSWPVNARHYAVAAECTTLLAKPKRCLFLFIYFRGLFADCSSSRPSTQRFFL